LNWIREERRKYIFKFEIDREGLVRLRGIMKVVADIIKSKVMIIDVA
jgi:hypothetical protein